MSISGQETDAVLPKVQEYHCPECGKTLLEDDLFCPYCGTEQTKDCDAEPGMSVLSSGSTRDNRCPKCGQCIHEAAAFCPYCGNDVRKTDKKTKLIINMTSEKQNVSATEGNDSSVNAGSLEKQTPSESADEFNIEGSSIETDENKLEEEVSETVLSESGYEGKHLQISVETDEMSDSSGEVTPNEKSLETKDTSVIYANILRRPDDLD
jgi:hypothetical protein